MRNIKKIIVLATIIGLYFVFPAAAQKTKGDFQKMYMDYLKKQGYSPSVDNDGDILFKYKGDNYYIIVKEDEPQLFVLMEVINMEDTPRQKSVEAANYANSRSYVTTVYISQDGKRAHISCESLLIKPKDFQQIFPKALELLLDAERNFLAQF